MTTCHADQEVLSLFPIENYSQQISHFIQPSSEDYDQPLMTDDIQQAHYQSFYKHEFGKLSPWDVEHVAQIVKLAPPDDLKAMEQSVISIYSNDNKSANDIGYGENFRPHTRAWINDIVVNVNLNQFVNITYHNENRAIAVDNLHTRALPTDDVHFYSHKLAGQGYPFDNLQMTATWIGTPLYILGESKDHAWYLVLTPDTIGWVKSSGVARVDARFIATWMNAAKSQLAAITKTQTSLVDADGHYLATAYVGAVLPVLSVSHEFKLMVPGVNADRKAVIKTAAVSTEQAASMPLAVTKHNIAKIMETLIGRPYGWGNMYFYNDCSAELKSLFTPFGVWLPRHSSDQVSVGKLMDMSYANKEERMSYLRAHGVPLLTLVYIGGHVILYVGNIDNTLMTYQDMWGLKPMNPPARRTVIGQSVLFPLLASFPEDASLRSQADMKYFQLSFLNEIPAMDDTLKARAIYVREMMIPSFN